MFLPFRLDTHSQKIGSFTKSISETNRNIDKIAFLFLTRDNLLAPNVWDEFFGNEHEKKYYNIYIHCKYCLKINNNKSYLSDNILPDNLIINNTKRYSFSLIKASNSLIKYAYNDDLHNKKFILLSESHIPIYNFNYIYNQLINTKTNKNKSFVQMKDKQKERYFEIRKHYLDINKNNTKNNSNFTLQYISNRKFKSGSHWIILDRYIVKNYLLKYEIYWNKFYRINCFWRCVAEENYYQTLIQKYLNTTEQSKYIINESTTYLEWPVPHPNGHPKTFEYIRNNFIDKIRLDKSFKLFLRKITKTTAVNVTHLLNI